MSRVNNPSDRLVNEWDTLLTEFTRLSCTEVGSEPSGFETLLTGFVEAEKLVRAREVAVEESRALVGAGGNFDVPPGDPLGVGAKVDLAARQAGSQDGALDEEHVVAGEAHVDPRLDQERLAGRHA